jgi:hypothetical protein
MGEVEGSDAYHGPDDLLPPESLVTHGTVPTRQLWHKRSGYIVPGRSSSYAAVLLWTAGASIVASIIGRTLVETVSPSDSRRGDVRDRDVSRFGEYASRWFLVAGAAAALVMAMAKVDYFWIANVIYLGFVLWAVAGSALKLVAYRRGL